MDNAAITLQAALRVASTSSNAFICTERCSAVHTASSADLRVKKIIFSKKYQKTLLLINNRRDIWHMIWYITRYDILRCIYSTESFSSTKVNWEDYIARLGSDTFPFQKLESTLCPLCNATHRTNREGKILSLISWTGNPKWYIQNIIQLYIYIYVWQCASRMCALIIKFICNHQYISSNTLWLYMDDIIE